MRSRKGCYAQVRSKWHDPWREDIPVDERGDEKTKMQGLLLIRHNLCVFPVTTTHLHSHNSNSYGNRSLSIRILNNSQVLMPPGTSSKGALANRSFCFIIKSEHQVHRKINYPGTALSRSHKQHLPWYITFSISLLKLDLTLRKGVCRYLCQL